MSSLQIDAVLSQIRAMQSQIRGVAAPANEAAQAAGANAAVQGPASSFANVMKQGLDQVNQTQIGMFMMSW
jgi:flagellar hook-basal body complex protein FliE